MGQVALSERIGIANGSISAIENGRTAASPDQLRSMAAVLGCTPEFLVRPGKEVLITRPWLRAYADAPKRQVDQQLADVALAVDVATSARLRRIGDSIPRFDGDPTDDHAIEAFSTEVRAAAGFDEDAVMGNTIRAAETLGCLVLPMPDELGRHLGMSVWADQGPVICVSRPSENPERHVPGDRQRFTVAHELAHLALHSDVPAPQTSEEAARLERQAHRFAGAFLAPGDALIRSLGDLGGRVTLQTLAPLKATWGIAIKALVVRFRSLGVIDDAHARSLYKQISARGWNKSEPTHVGNEEAVWISRAARSAFPEAHDPLGEVARAVGIHRRHVIRWTTWSPTPSDDEIAPVIDLQSRAPVG